jgi:predicted ester cyclase
MGALYAASATLESPLAGMGTGREAVVRASEGFFAAFPDATIVAEPPMVDGDRATIIAEVSGRHIGTFMGLPPSGRAFRFVLVSVLELRDRQIVRERRIYDFTGLLVQVGVLKAKPV